MFRIPNTYKKQIKRANTTLTNDDVKILHCLCTYLGENYALYLEALYKQKKSLHQHQGPKMNLEEEN